MVSPVSAASYVVEPPDLWSAHSIAGAPEWDSGGDAPAWVIGDFRCTVPGWQMEGIPGVVKSAPADLGALDPDVFSSEARLASLDAQGVAAEVLYPTPQLWGSMSLLLDGDAEVACARAYNDWLGDFVRAAPERFAGVAVIPSHAGTDAAVAEVRRTSALGLRGALLHAFPTSGDRALAPEDDAFWSALCDHEIVLSLDATFGPTFPSQLSGAKGTTAALASTSFVYEGVVERFPDLRLVLASPTAGWIPHWLERADDVYLRRPASQNQSLTRTLPSDYLRVRPYFTFSGDDLLLEFPDDYVSFTHLMWSSQHPTYFASSAADAFPALSKLSSELQDRIVATTCRGLYGLPDGAPVDLEPEVNPLAATASVA